MNKMNLPVPFGGLRLLPPHCLEVLRLLNVELEKDRVSPDAVELQKTADDKVEELPTVEEHTSSETESELESDVDESAVKRMPTTRPIKRKRPSSKIMNKRPNFSLLKQTCVSHPRPSIPSVSEAFENVDSIQSRKLELRLKGTLPSETDVSSLREEPEPGGFGKIEVVKEPAERTADNPVEWKGESSKYMPKEDIQKNRINKAGNVTLFLFCREKYVIYFSSYGFERKSVCCTLIYFMKIL